MSALWEPITLGEHFLRGAEQYGDRIALSDGTQEGDLSSAGRVSRD